MADAYSAFYNSGHEFPTCFSKRDVNFLRKEIEEVFKSGKRAVEEINKTNPQAAFAFTLFDCIKGKSEQELSFETDRDSGIEEHSGVEQVKNTGQKDKSWTFLLLIMI